VTSPTAARMPGVQIPSRAAAASTGVPGLGTHTAAPVPAPFFTVDRPTRPSRPVAAAEAIKAPSKTSSASTTPAPRRRRRGRPRDRFPPRHDRPSPRTHMEPIGVSDRVRMHPKSKKKPPTAIILGNDVA